MSEVHIERDAIADVVVSDVMHHWVENGLERRRGSLGREQVGLSTIVIV